MKTASCLVLALVASIGITLAQDKIPNLLSLRTGAFVPAPVSTEQLRYFDNNSKKIAGQQFAILQFESIPTAAQRKQLRDKGIRLMDYIPGAAYTASITKPLSLTPLKSLKVRAILPYEQDLKVDKRLKPNQTKDQEVMLSYFTGIPFNKVEEELTTRNFSIIDTSFKHFNIITITLPAGKLNELAGLPFVQYIEQKPPPPVNLIHESKNITETNILQSNLPGKYNLTGEGVTIGIFESASGWPFPHADWIDRMIEGSSEGNYHATHVFGIAAGGGIINERNKGYAPKSRIIGQQSWSYFAMERFIRDSGMVAGNHSYGDGYACTGSYALYGIVYDKVSGIFPTYQNVFACGNGGTANCNNGYPTGFGTIAYFPGANSGKNVLSVGSILKDGSLWIGSSRGPGLGGLLKPEVTAPGAAILSTTPNNNYGNNTGTSMAAPAVVGGLALLNQRYRQLNNNNLPDAGLMKAVICNSATDAGNVGPDYSFGFGVMNLLRAAKTLDNHQYFTDSVSNASQKQHTIQVPSGATQLKVMLYWNDVPLNTLSSRMLINDLDLKVANPSGTSILPLTLETDPTKLTLPATRKEDHVNNIEQVLIDNPDPGNYTITVRGTEIGQGDNQLYYIAYDIIDNNVKLTYPDGGEGLVPGETINIRWEAFRAGTSTYKLEYSLDDGASWQEINPAVAANLRQFPWVVPATATEKARIRITQNESGLQYGSGTFVIIGVPVISLTPVQCPGTIRVQWPVIPDATDYEVFVSRNGQMESAGITTTTNFAVPNLSLDKIYWVGVRARINGKPGLRSVAVSRKPDTGTCAGDISDGDLQLLEISSPRSGRKLTSTELSGNETVKIKIRNLDDLPSGNFTVKYNFNNGPWIEEVVTTPIPAGSVYEHSFATTVELSEVGDYPIKAAVKGNIDLNPANDSGIFVVRQISNLPLSLNTALLDSFPTAAYRAYSSSFTGLQGADRFDYIKETGNLNFYFYVPGFPDGTVTRPGFGLDMTKAAGNGHHQFIGTYNLSAFDTSQHNIVLRFVHSLSFGGNHLIYIRGNDTLPWVLALDLNGKIPPQNRDLYAPAINIGSILRKAGQNYSSSFQVAFDQANISFIWTISEIDLINASNDLELISIDSIRVTGCRLGNAIPFYVKLVNYGRQAAVNVPVRYRVNGGPVISETIAQLLPDSIINYRFNSTLDLSAPGNYTVEAWIDSPTDNLPLNNSKKFIAHSQDVINRFPYLEDFEKGEGNWYRDGANPSWEYGNPASVKINSAASGQRAWKTRLSGNHNAVENSSLYSPCFDLSSLQRPVLSFSMAMNMDVCFPYTLCESLSVQYSTNSVNYTTIPQADLSYNYETSMTGVNRWRWKVSTSALPDDPQLRIRFQFRSNRFTQLEGLAIDNIHIYDSLGSIYNGTTTTAPVEQTVSGGSNWIPVMKDNGIIASINPFGQDLGLTKTSVYINNGAQLNFHGQYYLNRSFMITSAKKPLDSIGVRLYFRDSEADTLIFAKNCVACTKPANAHRFGVSAYNSTVVSEYNNSILDNQNGQWNFLDPSRVRIIPYDNGYYAEFKVKDLSEFWLSDGGLDDKSYLPVKFLETAVSKFSSTEARLSWSTAAEINIHHFDIEVAKGNEAFQQGNYTKTGELASKGQSSQPQSYNFTDASLDKSGVYYYRIKALDEFGNYSYSKAMPVVWSDEFVWQVFPNPSRDGQFTLQYQLDNNEEVRLNIYNSAGALIKQQKITGNGFVQQTEVKLDRHHGGGLYLLRAKRDKKDILLKMIKQ
jgi:hypothetical protein